MNVLIIGEFSAFAKHLKAGFKQLGHNVTITQDGDGWKNIEGDNDDICYKEYVLRFMGKDIPHTAIFSILKANRFIKRKLREKYENQRPDLIIVINYIFTSSSINQAGVKLSDIQHYVNKGSKLILSVCGGDPAMRYTYPDIYKEWGQDPFPIQDDRYSFLIAHAHKIIPTTYLYYEAIRNYSSYESFDVGKISRAIPLPMTTDEKCQISSCLERKIVIFHGIIRPLMKGTFFIQPAMERIQKEFPDRVVCICKGNMPYDEYVKVFENVDVLIDQASGGNGWGINAAIGAMKGKCVLTTCGPENGENMGIPDIPFVQIKRDENHIYETLKRLILHPEEIDKIKFKSRKFMEQYCDSRIIAKRYLEEVNL